MMEGPLCPSSMLPELLAWLHSVATGIGWIRAKVSSQVQLDATPWISKIAASVTERPQFSLETALDAWNQEVKMRPTFVVNT
jgi:hypothetical protein